MSAARAELSGQPVSRVDGRLKVCGQAPYAADFRLPGMVHAVIVQSTIAKGRIRQIESGAALNAPGVLAVLTHKNAIRLSAAARQASPPESRVLSLLQDDLVSYNGQPVAVVVADTLEHARHAARLLVLAYEPASARLDFALARQYARDAGSILGQPSHTRRGDLDAAMAGAAQRLSLTYTTPVEHHNPLEPHASIASWDGDKLTLYDATQGVSGARKAVAGIFSIAPEKVTVICPFVGGGFGCKGSSWSHVSLAAMAARKIGRPVKLVLDRTQMFGPVGNRPRTEQTLRLGAAADGALTALAHDVISETSTIEDWTEPSALVTRMLYASQTQATSHRLVSLNIATPTFTRAPGEASGTFALECALDEMAYKLDLDPLELRLRNYAERDPGDGKPFSSKSLRECYRLGAEHFGWTRRSRQPASMRDGRWQIGMGMATATYPTRRSPAQAQVRVSADGMALVRCGTQDLGTGTYTVMTQVAADALGLPLDRVRFELGDSRMPAAPVSGGSQTVASVAPAVLAAALKVRARLIDMAITDARSPLYQKEAAALTIVDGMICERGQNAGGDAIAALIGRHRGQPIEAEAMAMAGDEKKQFSMHAFGAVFVEAWVDAELGTVRVPRIVAAYGVGNLLNAKTGRSQLMGGIVWGIGMALSEETVRDVRNGRHVNGNLAEYHVPVNADIGHIEVLVVPESDPHVNPLGAKGIGEIGITGVAGAIGNAVYHATGRRIRDLPITLDKLV